MKYMTSAASAATWSGSVASTSSWTLGGVGGMGGREGVGVMIAWEWYREEMCGSERGKGEVVMMKENVWKLLLCATSQSKVQGS